jgi:hypothetical protein
MEIVFASLLVLSCIAVCNGIWVRYSIPTDDPDPAKVGEVLWGIGTGSAIFLGWIYVNQLLSGIIFFVPPAHV